MEENFLDLEKTLCQDDVDNYSRNMDRLFAEDESNNTDFFLTPKPEKSPPKNVTYFSAAAFRQSQKIAVLLTNLDGKLYFLMCDATKKVLEKLEIDEMDLQFSKEELAIRFLEESIKFVDLLTFLRFAVISLIRSKNHAFFKLSEGSGDVEIDSNCDIRYNITNHSLDEDGLRLPDERKGVKTRLSKEKLEEHNVYKYLKNAKKNCHFLIKSGEKSVLEVIVDKVRRFVDSESVQGSENSKFEEPPGLESSPDAPEAIPAEIPPEEPVEAPEASPDPDLRDTLHRIIGIELDRIEMRLNERFNRFQAEVTARLDRQTDLLQQVLDKL